MRRFLEIDDAPSVTPKDDAAVKVAPVIDLAAERLARVTEDLAAAKAAGSNVRETYFELGTLVNETGVENLKKSRQAYDALPDVTTGLNKLAADIAAERRRDRIVPIKSLVYTADGRLGAKGVSLDNAATFTPSGFDKFADSIGVPLPAARWARRQQPLSAAAAQFNHAINKHNDDDKVLVRARDRRNGDGRNVYSVLSPSYTPINANVIVAELLKVDAFRDAKVDVSYDWETTRCIVDVTFHTDIDAGNAACGEYFKAGVRLSFSDVGGQSVSVAWYLERNLCLNFIIIHTDEVALDRIVHRGSVSSRLDKLNSAIERSHQAIGHFASKWTAANRLTIDEPRETVGRVKKGEDVKAWAECSTFERVAGLVNGYSKAGHLPSLSQQTIAGIATSYFKDEITSGEVISLAGVVNSITRYAHEGMDRWSGDALERAAGSLTWNQQVQPVFQYVSVTR